MRIGTFEFNRMEFSGSLGDLGTLIPLSVALITLTNLNFTIVFLGIGLFYIGGGLYFKLPIPVQPLKVMAAIAIAFPGKVTLPILSAAGITIGIILLLLACTGLVNTIARLFSKTIVRGIQLGLGLILIEKGMLFIVKSELFANNGDTSFTFFSIPINTIIGFIGGLITILLFSSKRFPAALILVISGIIIGFIWGMDRQNSLVLDPIQSPPSLIVPSWNNFVSAFFLLVLPQIPLTLSNAMISTADACKSFFGSGEATKRVSYKAFATSMGLANIIVGIFGGLPMCHGAGGLAAHYRFGARTGGSNLMIGCIFLILALIFGNIGILFLKAIPNAVLGILLFFTGIELALLIKDIKKKNDFFLVILIAGVGVTTQNMGIAFLLGIMVMHILRWRKIEV